MTQSTTAHPDAALFRAVVEHAPEAIVVTTPVGVIAYINPAAERLFGYSAAEAVGQGVTMLVPPQEGRRADPIHWLARWAAEAQPEQSRFLNFEARCKDGRPMPVDVRVASGEIDGRTHFIITVRDNTAIRDEHIAARVANLRATRILLIAEDAIVSCDQQQRITFFNLAAERMFGYGVEDVMGKPLSMLMPPDVRARHVDQLRAFGEGKTPSRMMSERAAVQGLRRSGETFPLEAAITKVAAAGSMTFTAHLRDITARVAAEAALRERERRFHAIFDHAADAIALLAPDGEVLEINRSARAFTTGPAAPEARFIWDLPWAGAGADDVAGRQRLRDAVASAAKGMTVRFTVQLRDGGGDRAIDLIFTPIADETGKVIYVLPEGHERAS